MKIIQTTYHNREKNTSVLWTPFVADTGNQELAIINLYPNETFQQMTGFGGAFTEAAGYVFSTCPESLQKEMIAAYFGRTGLRYTLGRGAIDSCDFALGNYSAVTDPADGELESFSLSRDETYIIPLIKQAMVLQPDLQMMLSPWSPPAYMKTNGQKNGGGSVLPEYRLLWAKYMCRYIKEYIDRGIRVFGLSVQNEPNAAQTWDSCVYSAQEEKIFVRDFLGPELASHGLTDVVLTLWDHNKERLFERADFICSDKKADAAVGAVGFHWYSGDHFEAIELVRRKYPDKLLIFTEGCIEYSKFSADSQLKHAQMYAHDMIGNLQAGMNAFIDWNLFLYKNGGPNHANNLCEAPIMADVESGCLQYNLSYDYIGHFSRHIHPMAVRIGVTRYTDALEVTAFSHSDESIAVVILNRTEKAFDCFIRLQGNVCPLHIAPESISTLVIDKDEGG